MRFEARDLKPYIEPVKTADLVVGHLYFRVSYLDQDMIVPDLESIVFIGRNLHPDGPGLYYQDAPSFLSGARFDVTKLDGMFPATASASHDRLTFHIEDAWLDVYPEREDGDVLEFDEALACLMRCSLRHQAWDGTLRPIPEPTEN